MCAGGCLGQDGSQQLPLDGSRGGAGGGGERKNNKIHRHAYADTESRQKHTERADAQTHTTGCDWKPAKHRRFIARGQSASRLKLFWRRSTKTSRQNSLSCFPVALHESMPLRVGRKISRKAGNTVGLFTLLGAGRKGPFSCRMANDLVKHLAALSDSCEERLQLEPQRAPAV